jgi:hypothetical protein
MIGFGAVAFAAALASSLARAPERADAGCAYCEETERLAASMRCGFCEGDSARCDTCVKAAKALRDVAGCKGCGAGCADRSRCAATLPAGECPRCAVMYAVVRNLSCSAACREATLMADPGAHGDGTGPKLGEAMGGLEKGASCEGCRDIRFHVLYSGVVRCGVSRLLEESLDLDPGSGPAPPGEPALPGEPGPLPLDPAPPGTGK